MHLTGWFFSIYNSCRLPAKRQVLETQQTWSIFLGAVHGPPGHPIILPLLDSQTGIYQSLYWNNAFIIHTWLLYSPELEPDSTSSGCTAPTKNFIGGGKPPSVEFTAIQFPFLPAGVYPQNRKKTHQLTVTYPLAIMSGTMAGSLKGSRRWLEQIIYLWKMFSKGKRSELKPTHFSSKPTLMPLTIPRHKHARRHLGLASGF